MDGNTQPLWWELSDRLEFWTRKIVQKGLGVSRWLHLCHLTVIMEPKMGCELERFALLCYVGSTHPMDENRVLCFVSMRKAFPLHQAFYVPPVLWTGAFLPCVYGTIKVGRNAAAFLGNAADKRRMRTALGSVHGIIKVGRNASETRIVKPYQAAFRHTVL